MEAAPLPEVRGCALYQPFEKGSVPGEHMFPGNELGWSHPIGRVVGRRPKYMRSGDTGSKPPGVPCGVAQLFCAALGPYVSGVYKPN